MKLLEILFYILSGVILRSDYHGVKLCSRTMSWQTVGTVGSNKSRRTRVNVVAPKIHRLFGRIFLRYALLKPGVTSNFAGLSHGNTQYSDVPGYRILTYLKNHCWLMPLVREKKKIFRRRRSTLVRLTLSSHRAPLTDFLRSVDKCDGQILSNFVKYEKWRTLQTDKETAWPIYRLLLHSQRLYADLLSR